MSVIIRLQGLPLSAASADIRAFFAGLNIPDGAVNIVGGDEGDAFIGFATDEDARQAMRKNNGLIHNIEVRLFLSSHVEMTEVISSARIAASLPTPSPMNGGGGGPPRYGSMAPPPSRYEREEPQPQSRFMPPRDELPPRFPPRDQPQPHRYSQEPLRFPPTREEQPQFPPREDPRFESSFNRDAKPPPPFGRNDDPRYGSRDGPAFPPPNGNNGRPPFAGGPGRGGGFMGGGGPPTRPPFNNDGPPTRFDGGRDEREGGERGGGGEGGRPGGMERPQFEMMGGGGRMQPPQQLQQQQSPFQPPPSQFDPRKSQNGGGGMLVEPWAARSRDEDSRTQNGDRGRNEAAPFYKQELHQERPPLQQQQQQPPYHTIKQEEPDRVYKQEYKQEEPEQSVAMPTREPGYGVFNRSEEERKQPEGPPKEESWRGGDSGNRSFERKPAVNSSSSNGRGGALPPPPVPAAPPIVEDTISFFGRAPAGPPKMGGGGGGLAPPPFIPPPSFQPPPMGQQMQQQQQQQPAAASNAPKEEVFVELTRLPPDLLRPSVLEDFLAPSTPLTLSSVKVVYGPEGIHLQSLVRFTSAMDAFNALKKDGEQGVKIRPSTKEAFFAARDGPPPSLAPPPPHPHPHMMGGGPPHHPHMLPPHLLPPHPAGPSHPLTNLPPLPPPSMGGGPISAGPPPLNLLNMNLMNHAGDRMHDQRRERAPSPGRDRRRRREESPPRGRREERRKRTPSPGPRHKKPRPERFCVRLSNIPFKARDSEIKRGLNLSSSSYTVKKVFTEDNSPSDVWVLEFATAAEAASAASRRFEMGGRSARLSLIDEPEADRLLRQKYRSPPREKKEAEAAADSFEELVRQQQLALKDMERGAARAGEALAGAFSTPIFTTNRGFMRGGRGGGRGMRGGERGMSNGIVRGGGRGGFMGGRREERTCLLVSNMPPLPAPQILLEHLRVEPGSFVRCDQIAPDAAIIELKRAEEAIVLAEAASMDGCPPIQGRRLIVAAMSRRQIEEEFNLRGVGAGAGIAPPQPAAAGLGGMMPSELSPSRFRIDPEILRTIGDPGCIVACDGFPRDLAIDEVRSFFDGFPMIESSVRMRLENGEGTGECMLAFAEREAARRAVAALNGHRFRGKPVALTLIAG